jgi:hypothetical protein
VAKWFLNDIPLLPSGGGLFYMLNGLNPTDLAAQPFFPHVATIQLSGS